MDIVEHDGEGCPRCDSGTVVQWFHAQDIGEEVEINQCRTCGYEWMNGMKKMTREAMLHWRPMLAANFVEGRHDATLTHPDYIQELKMNGDRVIAVFGDSGQFFTRTISRKDGLPVEKTDWLPHLAKLSPSAECESCILDGEVIVPGYSDHTKVAARFGCGVEKSLERQKKDGAMILVIWDVLMMDGEDFRERPLRERIAIRDRIVRALRESERGGRKGLIVNHVKLVPTGSGHVFIKEVLAMRGEGIIVKNLNAKYYSDGRPAGIWMKRKEEDEVDLYITGFKAAKEVSKKSDGTVSVTKYKGQIGSLDLSAWDGKKSVFICNCSGITDLLRMEITANPDIYLGCVVRVKCQKVMRAKDGSLSLQNPRVDSFRDDKNPKDCDYESLEQKAGD